MATEPVYMFRMSTDAGLSWQMIADGLSREDMHQHIGRVIASRGNGMTGIFTPEILSIENGPITVMRGATYWEWQAAR